MVMPVPVTVFRIIYNPERLFTIHIAFIYSIALSEATKWANAFLIIMWLSQRASFCIISIFPLQKHGEGIALMMKNARKEHSINNLLLPHYLD
jgi:hypothetical protein